MFIFRYFAAKASDKPLTKTKEVIKDDDDIESVSDDEFERFLSTADGSSTLEEYNFSEGTRGCFRTKQKPRISPDDEDSSTDDELDEDMGNISNSCIPCGITETNIYYGILYLIMLTILRPWRPR